MNDINISFVCATVRPQNWMSVYDSIRTTRASFEMIFVGPNCLPGQLPENFRFIQTPVKATQCWEIGVRQASGEVVVPITDDIVFSPGGIDLLWQGYVDRRDDYSMISPLFKSSGEDLEHCMHFFYEDQKSPRTPITPLIKKTTWLEVGGIDRQFMGAQWDVDLFLRILAGGGTTEIIREVSVEESEARQTFPSAYPNNLCSRCWKHDKPLLDSFWVSEGKLVKNRTAPVSSFLDQNILSVDQH